MLAVASTLPVPSDYHAGSTGKWLFTIWAGGFALVALPWVFRRLLRDRDTTPLFVWIGGLICSLAEPLLDHVGHLWWPQNLPGPAFKGYDLSVPLLIPPCYVAFISMTGYFAYWMMRKGLTVRKVFYVWLAVAATDLALEIPGTAPAVYKYYGDQPFSIAHFPMHWAWMNGTAMLTVGFVIWLLAPRLQGYKRLLMLFAPVIGFMASYGIVSWPAFFSINASMSSGVMHLVDLGSLALCLLLVRGIAAVVAVPATSSVPVPAPAAPAQVPVGVEA
jgi:hypothetical protein